MQLLSFNRSVPNDEATQSSEHQSFVIDLANIPRTQGGTYTTRRYGNGPDQRLQRFREDLRLIAKNYGKCILITLSITVLLVILRDVFNVDFLDIFK